MVNNISGHEPYSTDVQQYSMVTEKGPCIHSSDYICTATNVSELDWKLHGHHTYYMTIKATNLAGLFVLKTSVPYSHDTVLPSKGIVIDVLGNSTAFIPIKVYGFNLIVNIFCFCNFRPYIHLFYQTITLKNIIKETRIRSLKNFEEKI